jgi:hypothetical protein
VLEEAYRCIKPGGYIELAETHRKFGTMHASPRLRKISDHPLAYARSDDGSLKEDNPLAHWCSRLNDAINATGRVGPSEELLRERLEKAGFVDVQSLTVKLPFGPWAKDKYEH